MSRPLLSAALIVRNESRFLPDCLASIAGLVDEIVVVDTGSTDDTPAIARRHGARVEHMRWRGDFAAARNRSLALARGRWILYIDADERVRSANVHALRQQMRNPHWVGLTVSFHPSRAGTPFRLIRLFRNDPRIRFTGVMHETMMAGLERVIAEDSVDIGTSRVVVDHVGYEGDQRRKWRRNVPLLRRAIAQWPERIWTRAHLASIYVSLGRHRDAERQWKDAVALVRASNSRDLHDSVAHAGYAAWLLNHGRDCRTVLHDGLARFPQNMELRWIRARWLMQHRRWAEAIRVLEELTTHRGGRRLDGILSYPQSIFGAEAFSALGACCLHLRRFDEAARWYARARRDDPANREYVVKAQLARALSRQTMLAS